MKNFVWCSQAEQFELFPLRFVQKSQSTKVRVVNDTTIPLYFSKFYEACQKMERSRRHNQENAIQNSKNLK